jgi:hypothetical protein
MCRYPPCHRHEQREGWASFSGRCHDKRERIARSRQQVGRIEKAAPVGGLTFLRGLQSILFCCITGLGGGEMFTKLVEKFKEWRQLRQAKSRTSWFLEDAARAVESGAIKPYVGRSESLGRYHILSDEYDAALSFDFRFRDIPIHGEHLNNEFHYRLYVGGGEWTGGVEATNTTGAWSLGRAINRCADQQNARWEKEERERERQAHRKAAESLKEEKREAEKENRQRKIEASRKRAREQAFQKLSETLPTSGNGKGSGRVSLINDKVGAVSLASHQKGEISLMSHE